MTQKTYDVTNLTASQRRQLLQECMAKRGFTAFKKNRNDKQTNYTFQYIDTDLI